MKKFLSVLLAVMMILSTVSFAAPTAMGALATVETAPEAEEVAELSAVITDKSAYGTLIYKVDFENDNFDVAGFSTAYKQLKDGTTASYINPAFDTSNATCYTNAAGDGFKNAQLVTEGGNTYIPGNVNAGYSGFFRMTKYNCAWPEGYYTFVVDVKAPAGQVSSFAQQCNDTAVAIKTISAFNTTNGGWQTVVNQTTNVVNGADIYGYFVTPNNATAGTVSYDNWEVYYRPATVTLTIAGEEYEVSTDSPVSVASLASKVSAPTGYVLSGLSLTEGGEFISDRYYFEDATLYPTFSKDPNIDPTYGKALFVLDFENAVAQNWWGHSAYDNSSCDYGARVYEVASSYDARFAEPVNFRLRFVVNENTHVDMGTKVDGSGDHYTEGTTQTQWPQINVSNWGNVMGAPGYYTYMFDVKVDNVPGAISTSSAYGGNILDDFGGTQGAWDRVVVQKELTAEGLIEGGNIFYFSLDATAKGTGKFAFDDLKLFYKPYTANVTLIANGEEYVAENISTAGVSADSIVAAAGVEIPYGKKAVLSETPDGESVGNVVYLAMDSTYYVSFVADDSITEYGKRLLLVDFENFAAGATAPDNKPLADSTSNFNGDWGHLTINYEVGENTIVEEDGNKIIKGQQGWSQIRINNANFETAPAGTYTMALKVKNYGAEDKYLSTKDQVGGTMATWVKAGDATGTNGNYFVVPGTWNEVAAELPMATKDFTIYHIAPMTTDVGFDNIALYYRPASVNLTVVDVYGDETVYENCNSSVNVDDLLADVKAPFGYKAALSAEKNGEPLTGTINLVSDAKLYVVLTADETVSFDYGKALFIIDFEKESMQGWDGNSQTLDNSVLGNGVQVYESASYYDPRFENTNYRVRFVINETTGLIDQKIVAGADGNHYTTGTNTSRWAQVVSTNWGNVQGEAGVYTFMYDVKIEETTETGLGMTHNALHDGNVNVVDGFCAEAGKWDTVVLQVSMANAGNIPKGTWGNFNFAANETTTLSFDNAKLYFKPFNATVELVANGAVVATKENVSTSGVLVSELVNGVKVKGFAVTGVKVGAKAYGLEETVTLPCDCQVELALEAQAIAPETPTTEATESVRVSAPTGIRFKASIEKNLKDNMTSYGWAVTRQTLLDAKGVSAADFTMEYADTIGLKYESGENYVKDGGVDKIYSEDDANIWFTAILYFAKTEEDGCFDMGDGVVFYYPTVQKLTDKLIAKPYTVVDGEYLYGEATAPVSILDVAKAMYENVEVYGSLGDYEAGYLYGLIFKADPTYFD